MRCDPEDPLYQVTFDEEKELRQFQDKRVGRPRGHWTETTMTEMMETHYDSEFDRDNKDHYIMLFSIALERL